MYIIKKIGAIVLVCSFLLPFTYAADISEEDQCFTLLNNALKSDNRFPMFSGKGLTEVEINDNKVDLSTYTNPDTTQNAIKNGFLAYRSKNPLWRTLSESERNILGKHDNGAPKRTQYDFLARRTNIATVITGDTFVVTNMVGFGQTSNFRFPLPITKKEKESGEKEFGDRWVVTDGDNVFQEYVLYAHHNIKGEFLSCGLFHVTPLDEYTYTTLQAENYYGNTLQGKKQHRILNGKNGTHGTTCVSGFRGEKIASADFYKMETDVCAMDFGENDFARMEILTLAYNNKSTYFNEYEIFPLQVSSMVSDITSGKTLQDVRDTFLEGLQNETCLSIVHASRNTLPEKCQGNYTSLSYFLAPKTPTSKESIFDSLLAFLIPSANAARDFSPSEETMKNAQGLVVFNNFPLELYQKLQSIPDQTFKDYALFALNPGYETHMQRKKAQGQYLSAFEQTFLNCDMSIKERTDVFIDLLEKMDVNTFNIANLSYSNPKVGDCIVPYPDVTHRDKEIEGSFASNIRIAKILNGTWETPIASDATIALIQEENTIQAEFEKEKSVLIQQFEDGLITSEELDQQIADRAAYYQKQIEQHQEKYYTVANQDESKTASQGLSQKYKIYITIAVIAILGILFLGFAFRSKRK